MKRVLLSGGGVLAVTLLAGCLEESGSRPTTTAAPFRARLMTARDGSAGTVTLESRDDQLHVTITADRGRTLLKTHAATVCAVSEVPQDSHGNPIPEFFTSQQAHDADTTTATHTLTLPHFGDCRTWIVVVHAFVGSSDFPGTQTRSAWGEGTPFLGNSGAMYMVYTPSSAPPPPPPSSLSLRTETQQGWISPGASDYLLANFHSTFPSGLTIGGANGFQVTFTSPEAVMLFLPQTGPAGPLSRSEMDPFTVDNELAGEAVALTLNVEFDLHDRAFGASDLNLAGLVVNDPACPFFGMTVLSVLDFANGSLAGSALPVSITYEDLRACLAQINADFEHGSVDHGFLRAP